MEQQENVNTNLNLTLKEKFKFFFTSPSKLFQYYRENPKFGILFLITTICAIIYQIIHSNLTKEIVKKQMEKQFEGLDPQALEMTKKTMDTMNNPALKIGSALIGVLIAVFGVALLIFIIFKISKVALSYQQTVTLYLVAGLSTCIGSMFKAIYMLISKKAVGTNAILNPSVKNTLIANIDIFNIWYYVLLGIGIYAMGKTSKKKATILTIILAILNIGAAVLPFLVGIKK
ncbi:YIP1 family protein [Clostridium botulinum]|uniref:Yip1 family protein n=1 Tax=Clostridium botulinum TaxID=1491 RepID=UPI0007E0EB65|nr:Yip1 family protein [Clostridium botulinum]AUM98686.1 YIP1 family protein [Clostridium botulinum]AUN17302.1 YIP1 family protein [Clostridium botulinum]KEI80579.1 membrane protein [Clostridium botulinum B2 331]KEI86627.1 membrane protein [Clostridium botulinum B2 267]MBN3348506.1 YIP1 family protein [Clostridium botulinum]